ncbi:transposase [Streptomyces niveus]
MVTGLRGWFPHPREKGGSDTGPSPVDRRKTGSKHHLICDGRGTPLKVITTAANVNDVTQTLALVDGIPPVAGRPGRPRRRPEALLGDKGYDSNPSPAASSAGGGFGNPRTADWCQGRPGALTGCFRTLVPSASTARRGR